MIQTKESSDKQRQAARDMTLTLTHNGTVLLVCIVDREEKDYTKWALEYLKEALVAVSVEKGATSVAVSKVKDIKGHVRTVV